MSKDFNVFAEFNSKLLANDSRISETSMSCSPLKIKSGNEIGLLRFFSAIPTYLRRRFDISSRSQNYSEPSGIHPLYLFVRFFTGFLLVAAAVSKLGHMGNVAITSSIEIPGVLYKTFALFEFALGWVCMSMIPHRWIAQTVQIVFGIFLATLILRMSDGIVSCQCLGTYSPSIYWMLLLDTLVLVLVFVTRKWWRMPVSLTGGFWKSQIRNLGWLIPVTLAFAVVTAGSIENAIGYVNGSRAFLNARSIHLGTVKHGESKIAVFEVRNPSRSPLRIIGAKSTCSCVAILDIPVDVPPGGSVSLRLKLSGSEVNKLQREQSRLIFDDPNSSVVLTLTGVVR